MRPMIQEDSFDSQTPLVAAAGFNVCGTFFAGDL
jgi:hypothetical protein